MLSPQQFFTCVDRTAAVLSTAKTLVRNRKNP